MFSTNSVRQNYFSTYSYTSLTIQQLRVFKDTQSISMHKGAANLC